MSTCPFCAEIINDGIERCNHCNSELIKPAILPPQAPQSALPRLVVKSYSNGPKGRAARDKDEAIMFPQGYIILQEENVKEFDSGRACVTAIIFLPFIFFAYNQKIKVTYELVKH